MTKRVTVVLNGANASMVSIITVKTHSQRRDSCSQILRLSNMDKIQETAVDRTHSEDGPRAKPEANYL